MSYYLSREVPKVTPLAASCGVCSSPADSHLTIWLPDGDAPLCRDCCKAAQRGDLSWVEPPGKWVVRR